MSKKIKGEIDMLQALLTLKHFRVYGWGLGLGIAGAILMNNFDDIVRRKANLTIKQVKLLRSWCDTNMPRETRTRREIVAFDGLDHGEHYHDCNGVERVCYHS